MLHLQARVHLHEQQSPVGCKQIFKGPSPFIAQQTDGLRGGHAGFAPAGRIDRGAWRLFDQLLMPTLHRTVALAEADHLAVGVGKNLNFDMPRCIDGLLQHHRCTAESGKRLRTSGGERQLKIGHPIDSAHATAPSPRARFDHEWRTDPRCFLPQGEVGLIVAVVSRDDGKPERGHGTPGSGFIAHQADGSWRRADKAKTSVDATLGELGILGKEAITRMNSLRARAKRSRDQRISVKVALCRVDPDRPVGLSHMRGGNIVGHIDRHRVQPQFSGGADDAQRNLAAVGHQYTGETPGGR